MLILLFIILLIFLFIVMIILLKKKKNTLRLLNQKFDIFFIKTKISGIIGTFMPKNLNFLKNNTKTIVVVTIFLYFFTFPMYHPDKAKNKNAKELEYEKYQLEHNELYKKRMEKDPINNSIFLKNQKNIIHKDDKLFFQFPWRYKKRVAKKNELKLRQLELLKLVKIETDLTKLNDYYLELEQIKLELSILKDKYGIE